MLLKVVYVLLPVCSILAFACFGVLSKLYVKEYGTYKAAVVEYHPVEVANLSATERLELNVREYLKILGDIKTELDIIVFPEATLQYGQKNTSNLLPFATLVPSIKEEVIPCGEAKFELFFQLLSCAAKEYHTYVFVNLLEKYQNQDKWLVYNTNVVFDRQGKLVSRYRKYNLHGEPGISQPSSPEIATFTTDFGVTFGVFICFDILHPHPALDLVAQGIKHFVFPNMWYSELPFLTSLQVQQMWSRKHNVVLLSAGANNPAGASGGSGIFQGNDGPIKTYFRSANETSVLITSVHKHWSINTPIEHTHEGDVSDFQFWANNFKGYQSEILNAEQEYYKVCADDQFCCEASIKWDGPPKDSNLTYYLFSYHGLRTFGGVVEAGIEVCSIVACANNEISSCTKRIPSNTKLPKFTTISINAGGSTKNVDQYPNTMTLEYKPMEVNVTIWDGKNIRLVEPSEDVVVFGIFGRYI